MCLSKLVTYKSQFKLINTYARRMDIRREQIQRLGFNIAKARVKKGISQPELARMGGYSGHAHISRIENGVKTPSLKAILAIADALDVPVKDFFEDM